MILKMNIHNRLALVLWGAALLAFVVTGTALVLFQGFTLEDRARQIMEPYAQMVSVGTDAAVAFEDPIRAQEILDTLRANPQILEADIVLAGGRTLAAISHMPNAMPRPFPAKPDGIYLSHDTAELLQSLPSGARLRLSMGLGQLSRQIQQSLWVFGGGVLLFLTFTLAQLTVLKRTIVRPITTLTEMAENVRARADYKQRVPAVGTDEVARLGHSFNAMMAAIQEREIELRRLTRLQRTILDNVAYAIISTTPDGIITSFNHAAERLLGYMGEEVVGKQTPALWHDPEEMAQRAVKLTEELGQTVAPGFGVFTARPQLNLREENEWTFIRKDGRRIPVNLSITPLLDEDARITGFVGLAYDLTERKQTQYQLQLLTFALDRVKETIFLMGENDSHFLYVNQSASQILGYSREELTGGMGVFDIDPDCSLEMWNAAWSQLCDQGRIEMETTHRAQNGRVFPVEVTANYLDFDGKIYNLAMCRDITERKRSEQERQTTLHFFESMDRINLAIQGAGNVEQLMVNVLDTVLEIFGCDRAWLCYPCDPTAATWRACMERTVPEYPGALIHNLEVPLDAGTIEVYRTVLSANEPVWFGSGSKHAFSEVLTKLFNIQSQLSMAIYPKVDKPYMFGLHQCSYPREWTTEETRLFQEIGRRLADGLTSMLSHRSLQESEAKYRRIVDTANEGIWLLEPNAQTSFVNARMAEMLGYSCEEMIGRPITDFMFAEDAPDQQRKMENRSQDLSGSYERRYRCKDGQTLWTLVSATPILDDGHHPIGMLEMFTDITERKRAEQTLYQREREYRTLVENIPDLIVRYDTKLQRIYVNPAWEGASGLSIGEVVGVPGADILKDSNTTANLEYLEKLRNVLETGTPQAIEFTWMNARGMMLYLQYVIVPEFDQHGQVVSILSVGHDITLRKQAEEELRHYKDQLEETVRQRTAELLLARDAAEAANKAKSVFLANMSHELRTPLNAILGFSSIMRNNPLLQENDRHYMDIINRSGEHLLTLINDVLEMAKIEAGRVQIYEAPFDLGAMVRDVANMMRVRAAEKGLQLQIDQSSEFPRYIVGDEARLRQVLINLVGNALKFTQQGGITIRLGTKINTNSHLLIEVEDSGSGIAPENQKRIFEPFVQLGHQADKRGTGLGLSITRQFVQLMNGHISLESTLGKGSLFRVDLPLKQAGEAEISNLFGLKQGEVLGVAPGQAEYRILIVEDQLENQLLLANLMEAIGFQYKVADNGKQGVELFQSWKPHLIWMDRQMPVLDGLETTKKIRGLPGGKDVKIVAVTASAFMEQRAEILDAGMDELIRKPYRAYEIYQCLTRQLGVQFVYSEPSASALETAVLVPEMLSVLPKHLCQDLENAVKSLESERIALIIQQIAQYDQKLANVLTRLNENYEYPAILKALRGN